MTTTAAIIQSRTGSTRYPNKAMALLKGVPVTEHIINRVKKAGVFDRIVLAVPDLPSEAPLEELASRLSVDFVAGPEEDVLQRFLIAADTVQAEHLLRVCGDNPLVDIPLMESLHKEHLKSGADYTLSKDPIPLGSGTEMVRTAALSKIAKTTDAPRYREHVTTYFHDHGDTFSINRISAPYYLRNIHLRLTLDTEEDLNLLQHLYEKFGDSFLPVSLEDVVLYLANRPGISGMNAHIEQKDWRA